MNDWAGWFVGLYCFTGLLMLLCFLSDPRQRARNSPLQFVAGALFILVAGPFIVAIGLVFAVANSLRKGA